MGARCVSSTLVLSPTPQPSNPKKPMAGRTEQRLSGLGQKGKVIAEYVWIGGAETTGGFDIRSKPKTLDSKPTSCSELPIWNYDGSSTGQAPGADSEVLLRPVAIFDDPFRGGDNVLVLCETLTPAMEPIPTNTRAAAKAIFDQKLDEKPWFGIEQEYTLYELDRRRPSAGRLGASRARRAPTTAAR